MRKAIGKRLRFDIFKRDGFVCQYCGAHPPSVVLQVDHITPVALGGQNDIDNLVTSCQPCNIGKGAVGLESVPRSVADKAKRVKEAEEQLAGYQKILMGMRRRITNEAERIRGLFELLTVTRTLTEKEMVSVRVFVERLGFDVVYTAMEKALTSPRVRCGGEFRYFCGICWSLIKAASE